RSLAQGQGHGGMAERVACRGLLALTQPRMPPVFHLRRISGHMRAAQIYVPRIPGGTGPGVRLKQRMIRTPMPAVARLRPLDPVRGAGQVLAHDASGLAGVAAPDRLDELLV